MVQLETTLVPKLEDHVQKWRRFVDDMFAYVKIGSVEYVIIHDNMLLKVTKYLGTW